MFRHLGGTTILPPELCRIARPQDWHFAQTKTPGQIGDNYRTVCYNGYIPKQRILYLSTGFKAGKTGNAFHSTASFRCIFVS